MTQLSGHDTVPRISGQVCPMLAVDIAESTRADRDVEIQRRLRTSLYGILREALDGCGMPWNSQCKYEDRGDGLAVIFPPDLAAQPIVDSFPDLLGGLIRSHNRGSGDAARMQLRMAAHIGPAYSDEHGFFGCHVTHLCRMLDAQALRRALAETGAEFALIVSDYLYDNLVLQRRSLVGQKSFRQVRTHVKRTPVRGWIYLPEASRP